MRKRSYRKVLRMLTDSDPVVRASAAKALGSIGPAAASAVPSLIKLLVDPVATVRAAAARALCLIGLDAASAVPARP